MIDVLKSLGIFILLGICEIRDRSIFFYQLFSGYYMVIKGQFKVIK